MKQREVDERIELDDVAVVAIVDKLVKQRKDSIQQFGAGGRQDLVDKETAELKVLEGYLPARLGAEEIAAEVAAIVAETGATSAPTWARSWRGQGALCRTCRDGPGVGCGQGGAGALTHSPTHQSTSRCH
jgi:Uncharacterized conserved protein